MQLVWILGNEECAQHPRAMIDVGGVSVARRAYRSMANTPITQIIATSAHTNAYASHTAHDVFAPILATWVEDARGLKDAVSTLSALEDKHLLEDSFMVLTGDRIVTPRLLQEAQEYAGPCVWLDAQGAPIVAKLMRAHVRDRAGDLHALVAQLVDERRVDVVHCEAPEFVKVHTQEEGLQARELLFETLRKPLGRQADGITAYFINRPISLFLSRRLMYLPVRPNHVTAFDIMLGISGGLLMAFGGVAGLVVGAIFMQLVSIFDGIDGELARMKVMMSKHGAWFDAIGDDIVKMAKYTALGYACSNIYGEPLYFYVMIMGFMCTLFMVFFWYRSVADRGLDSLNMAQWWFEREGREQNWWQKLLVGISYCLKRDTYTLLLVFLIVIGFPGFSFSAMTVGILIIFFATFGQVVVDLFTPTSQEKEGGHMAS